MPPKVLFITLSNIGDVVCTTPVLRALVDRPDHPRVSVLVGPKAAALFQGDAALDKVIAYDKHMSLGQKLMFVRLLKTKGFDEVVDLRNSLFPVAILGWRGLRSLFLSRGKKAGHAVLRHWRRAFGKDPVASELLFHVQASEKAQKRAEALLSGVQGPFVAVAPGAASDLKRWPLEKFAEILRRLGKAGFGQAVLVGGPENQSLSAKLQELAPGCALDLTGKTNLPELTAVLKRASVVLSNDSGPMHIAAALGTPVVAIFGPSDSRRYGPFGAGHAVVRQELPCSPCGKAQCHLGTHACMVDLETEQVWKALETSFRASVSWRSNPDGLHAKVL